MEDDVAQVVRCELDVADPSRVAIGMADSTDRHVFLLPREQARALAKKLLHLTGGSFNLSPGMSWEDGQCH